MADITEENVEEKLIEWSETKNLLQSTKAEEMEMRIDLVAFLSESGGPGNYRRGFETIVAKAKIGLNHKIDEDQLAIHSDDFTELEKAAVRYKPTLSITNYKKIPDAMRETLDDCIVVTLSAPTLSVDYRGPKDDG